MATTLTDSQTRQFKIAYSLFAINGHDMFKSHLEDFMRACGVPISKAECKSIKKDLNMKLSFHECLQLVALRIKDKAEHREQLTQIVDAVFPHTTGKIDKGVLEHKLISRGEPLSAEEVELIVDELPTDSHGKIHKQDLVEKLASELHDYNM